MSHSGNDRPQLYCWMERAPESLFFSFWCRQALKKERKKKKGRKSKILEKQEKYIINLAVIGCFEADESYIFVSWGSFGEDYRVNEGEIETKKKNEKNKTN